MLTEGQRRRDGQLAAPTDHMAVTLASTEPVPAFERRRRNGTSVRRLLERDEWQEEFAAAFAGLLPPSAVIIEGEPGAGKTALLNAACQSATDAGYEVLRARGGVRETEAPFGVVRQLLQPIQHELLPNERGLWEQLASNQGNGSRPMPFEAIHDVYLTLSSLASRQPLVIAVDDLHWCDIESLWWIQHLVRRLKPGHLLFVGTTLCRVTGTALGPVDNIVAEPSTRVISLRPLAAPSVEQLICNHLGIEPEVSFVETCLRLTGGNPFLLHSLLITLRLQGTHSDVSDEGLSVLSPPPVARALLTRLAGLPPEAQAFLRAAAVLGDGSDYRIVAELAGIDAAFGHDIANSLAEAHLLRKGRQLNFVHPLERSTIYGELDPVPRARAHAEAARVLDQNKAPLEQVARHLLMSETSDDEWSAELLEQAAQLYLQRGQCESAEQCLSRSLNQSTSASARPRRLLALASAQAAIGRPGALALLREAADLGADPVALADATYRCLKAYAQEVYPADTVVTLRHLESHLGEDNDELRIWIEIVLATWGPPSSARQIDAAAVEAIVAKKRLERSRQDRIALAHLSHVQTLAPEHVDANYVATLAEQSLHPGDFQPDDGTSVVVMARALVTLARTGRFDLVDRVGTVMQEAASRHDHAASVAEFSTVLAFSHFLQGNLDEAEAECLRALAATECITWAARPFAIGVLAASLTEAGRAMDAATALKSIPPGRSALAYGELLPLEQRAKLTLLEGHPNEALEAALIVKEGAEALGISNPAVTGWRSIAASALGQLGRLSEARELAVENLELARRFGALRALGEALRTAAEVGTPTERMALLEEAVDVLKRSGASLEYAKATVELGSALTSEGQQNEALRTLRRGADLAFHCRAQPLVERASKELRAAGARPRRLALMGSDALTPAERRVAALAADGLINAQIAEKLFISEKTVEGHLTRVYHKLGMQSRAELREILKPAPEIIREPSSDDELDSRAV